VSYTFTKLFSSITESTVWCEPDPIRIVWITMLAMADRQGRVWASIPGLANRARVSLEDCEKAIGKFSAPDPYSRTPDYEGRRIEPIDGGWRLLNHAKYVTQRDEEARRTYQREWIKDRRQKLSTNRQDESPIDHGRPPSTHADADRDTDKESRTRTRRASRLPGDFSPDLEFAIKAIPGIDAEAEFARFRDFWNGKPGASGTKADWPATWRNWIRTCKDSGKYAKAGVNGVRWV
jgi:hypothetical protein